MDTRIKNLYNDYRNGKVGRREFLRKMVILTGGTAAAFSILPSLGNNYVSAAATGKEVLDFVREMEYVSVAEK